MSPDYHADLILQNARVLTLEPGNPLAWYVAVKDGKILAVGDMAGSAHYRGPGTRSLDCHGMALLPGFVDAHCHLFALASNLRGVDCRPDKVGSIAQILAAISRQADGTQPGSWLRAFGYDEFYLAEKRHPTRQDLDRATPLHPVRLDHRTGHASVLNSQALQTLGITRDTPDPPGGVIERDGATGEPTGVLYEMGEYIKRAPQACHDGRPQREKGFLEGIRRADRLLLSRGVTSIQDASLTNDVHRWQTFQRLKGEGLLTPHVTMMAGSLRLRSFLDHGLTPGSAGSDPKLGAVKIVLGLTTGTLQPSREELNEVVLDCHRRGLQLAIHAVEEEAVEAAVDTLAQTQAALPRPDARHRIEHCSECPPHLLDRLKLSQALVVTQPSFVYQNGGKYLSDVKPSLLPHLYPLASLVRAGIRVAASSDAPVTWPDPLLSVYSAVTRNTRDGPALSPSQAIPTDTALRMHTLDAAYASFGEKGKGSIAPGKRADLVLLDADPAAVEPEAIKEIAVMMTLVSGMVVWEG